MKRCKFCGRSGRQLMDLGTDFGRRYWACFDRQACKRREKLIGQWTGVRVLRRRDLNGTEWEIRRTTSHRKSPTRLDRYALQMRYREHLLTLKVFTSVDEAKAHVDDLIASWNARSLRDYAEARR